MPIPKKRGSDMSSSLELIPTEPPRSQGEITVEGEVTTLDTLKEVLLKEISNVSYNH